VVPENRADPSEAGVKTTTEDAKTSTVRHTVPRGERSRGPDHVASQAGAEAATVRSGTG